MKKTEINANVNAILKLRKEIETLTAEMDALKDNVKAYMTEKELTEMYCGKNKVHFTEVTSERFDSKRFHKDAPEMYELYCKTVRSTRFEIN